MPKLNNDELVFNANIRLCRLCRWANYDRLGFNLEASAHPPQLIRLVESNSPAAASGLKILDVILSINQHDVSESNYHEVQQLIKTISDSNMSIELLVVKQSFYQVLKNKGIQIDSSLATVINAPLTMPIEYQEFPKLQPRTCLLALNPSESSFGFEIVKGINSIGAYVQEVFSDTAASRTQLCKSDRIIEIDDDFIDTDTTRSILYKLNTAEKKRFVKLYVMDTETYKHYQSNKLLLSSKVDEDIRLCAIYRCHPTDTYGFQLNYHKRDNYHSVDPVDTHNNIPSNAAIAGIKYLDHLIEVNGENIQNRTHEYIVQLVRSVKYPEPIQMLVVNARTYANYKQQRNPIHRGLPNVKILQTNPHAESTHL